MMQRLAACAVLLLATGNAQASLLQEDLAAFAQTVGPEDFAFTRTTRVESSDKDSEPQTLVESYDPSRPGPSRWTLLSVDGRAPTTDELKRTAKARSRDIIPSYGRVALYVGAPATVTGTAAGRALLTIGKLPKGVMKFGDKDVSADTNARVSVINNVARPWVERVDFESNKPISMMLVAKVNSFKASTRFKLMPVGRPVPFEQAMTMMGSMFGRSGTLKTMISYSDHRPVRPRG